MESFRPNMCPFWPLFWREERMAGSTRRYPKKSTPLYRHNSLFVEDKVACSRTSEKSGMIQTTDDYSKRFEISCLWTRNGIAAFFFRSLWSSNRWVIPYRVELDSLIWVAPFRFSVNARTVKLMPFWLKHTMIQSQNRCLFLKNVRFAVMRKRWWASSLKENLGAPRSRLWRA